VTLYITPVFYIYLDGFQKRVFHTGENKLSPAIQQTEPPVVRS